MQRGRLKAFRRPLCMLIPAYGSRLLSSSCWRCSSYCACCASTEPSGASEVSPCSHGALSGRASMWMVLCFYAAAYSKSYTLALLVALLI